MLEKVKDAIFYTIILILAVSQTLFGMALLFGPVPADSSLGTFFLWASAIEWALLLLTGWGITNTRDILEMVFAVAMTVCAVIAITTAIVYIPILAQIAYILNVLIWTAVACTMIEGIFEN